jgi:L-aspartate oxidase
MPDSYDYIIVGSGIAGLYAAILAQEHGSVLVLTKGSIDDCNSRWAQGGIAASIGSNDSADAHLKDTVNAGAGLVDEEAAAVLTTEAANRIRDLVALGVPFDTLHGEIALALEGAHSRPRILHAGGDQTGSHIELTLSSVARREGITLLEHTMATEIVQSDGRVAGIKTLDTGTGETAEFTCGALIFATGGAGQMYSLTTNPDVATGDGIALAYNSGAEVMDMEFIQFHPTALRIKGVQPFLVSEAIRGEGGRLLDLNGVRFMPRYDERGELAPRDIVARAIADRMRETGSDHVLLDVTHLEPETTAARFPQVYSFCLDAGLDITRQPIPVAPAAHYTMGGIRTNTWGETTLPGLYAIGECACTGAHGANRLASNSLLETVVYAARAVQRSLDAPGGSMPPSEAVQALGGAEPAEVGPLSRRSLQELMWRDAGIVRDGESLAHGARILAAWQASMPPATDRSSLELAGLATCARLTTEAALLREESRGAHFRRDFPEPREDWRRHLVFRS